MVKKKSKGSGDSQNKRKEGNPPTPTEQQQGAPVAAASFSQTISQGRGNGRGQPGSSTQQGGSQTYQGRGMGRGTPQQQSPVIFGSPSEERIQQQRRQEYRQQPPPQTLQQYPPQTSPQFPSLPGQQQMRPQYPPQTAPQYHQPAPQYAPQTGPQYPQTAPQYHQTAPQYPPQTAPQVFSPPVQQQQVKVPSPPPVQQQIQSQPAQAEAIAEHIAGLQVSEAPPKKEGGGKKRRGKPKEAKAKESSEQIPPVRQEKADSQPIPIKEKSSALDFIVPQRKKQSSGGTKGRKILIETNHLALQFKNLGMAVHYDVAIDPDKPKKLMRVVMEQFRKQNYANRNPAFDGVKNLYSSSLLPFGQETSGEITIQEDTRDKKYKVKIKFARHVDLSVLSQYFQSVGSGNMHMVTPQEAIQCIDIVLRNAPSFNCIPVGRSFFTRPTDKVMDLGEGMEMYYGFYQSAVLGWKPFLNVDVSHKAFPKSMHVLNLIKELCDQRYDLNSPLMYENFETVNKFIKGLRIAYQIPNQPGTRRVMSVNGLDESAAKARFKNENNVEMSVFEYFGRVKNIKLKYPHLPCLWVGSRQRETRILLPPEFCTIMEGQVTNRSMTPNQTSSMIKYAATSTLERKHKIMNSINMANYQNDKCAKEFNITVNENFSKISARILEPPQLLYGERTVQPQRGIWRAEKFDIPEKLTNWCILCVDDRTRPQVLPEFAAALSREGRNLGMDIEQPQIIPLRLMRGKEKAKLEEEFNKLKDKRLILVVIPDFLKEIYNFVKQAAELSIGVVTQCVKGKNVFQKKPSTLSNILLKINAKLNGRNHHLKAVPLCLRRPCIIMGADVTHPSPETRGTVPSVAAVTASHDKFAFKYNITWRLQPSTQEIITDLTNIVREHLLYFYKQNNAKPERIIFFRDGVSEGQFEIVVHQEVQAIRRACTMLDASGDYKPRLTFLVVQKRHHTRFFPTNPRDSEDKNINVPAGTVVDTEITHPTALDFYLVSHASIQGVARPTKYRKLWDDDDMQEDELEELTYHLCHLFTRCTRSVSYPAPTYYAHLAAARAKVYCERRNINMNNLQREQDQLQIKASIIQNNPMFFV